MNINDNVLAKITPVGLAHLEREWNQFRAMYPKVDEWEAPTVDADGYSKWQLWRLMADLGKYCVMGMPIPISDVKFPGEEALEYVFGKCLDWPRIVNEKLTPPLPLRHHLEAQGLWDEHDTPMCSPEKAHEPQ